MVGALLSNEKMSPCLPGSHKGWDFIASIGNFMGVSLVGPNFRAHQRCYYHQVICLFILDNAFFWYTFTHYMHSLDILIFDILCLGIFLIKNIFICSQCNLRICVYEFYLFDIVYWSGFSWRNRTSRVYILLRDWL